MLLKPRPFTLFWILFCWVLSFSEHRQPIKMHSTARQCSRNLAVLQINLQNIVKFADKKKPYQLKTGFLHFISSCRRNTWGTSRQLVAKDNQHPCRKEKENVRWICQKWRRQKTSPWEWSSLEYHFRFHQRWR